MKKLIFPVIIFALITIGIFLAKFFDIPIFKYLNIPMSEEAAAARLKTGLIGHWTMDTNDIRYAGTATTTYDKSGNGYLGTFSIGANTYGATSTVGKIGQAVNFDGTDDSISATITQPSIWTASVWIKPCVVPAVAAYIMSINDYALDASLVASSSLRVQTANGNYIDSLKTIPTNQWTHVVYGYNGTNIFIYINGVLDVSVAKSATTGSSFLIGKRSDGYFWQGGIDDVRIYNRALSEREAGQLYTSGQTTHVQAASKTNSTSTTGGLVGYWTLDKNDIYYGGTATTTKDRSGNGNTGTFTIGTNTYGATSTAGKIGQAIDFDGQNDYISFPGLAWTPRTFSVAYWINPKSLVDYNQGILATNGWGAFDCHASADGSMYCGTDIATRFTPTQLPAKTMELNKWQQFVYAYDGTRGTVYKDGVKKAGPTVQTAPTAWGGFQIGQATASVTVSGAVDDVRVYDYALSASDVLTLYNSAKVKYTASAPKEGLVAHWTMDSADSTSSRLYDLSGKNNHGTPTGFYTGLAATSTMGKINQGISFDGKNGYFNIANRSNLNSVNFTFSSWIKPNVKSTNSFLILNANAAAQWCGWGVAFDRGVLTCGDGDLCLWVSQSCTGVAYEYADTVYDPPVGQWTLLSVTLSGTALKFYINGSLLASKTTTRTPVFGSPITTIGSFSNTSYFNGAMDDVRVYDRALTAAEISQLYESAKRGYD